MKLINWLISVCMIILLAACGGGGGSSGTSVFGNGSGSSGSTGSTGSTPTLVAVTLTHNSTVTVNQPVTATAKVTDASGNGISGVTVHFSVGKSLVALSTDSGTTDTNGMVSTVLTVISGSAYGTDTLTASSTSSGSTLTGSAAFTSNSATSIELLADSTAAPTAGDQTSNQVTITAIVKGAGSVGLANVPIVFSADSGTLLNPASTTSSAGVATVKFTSGANKSNRVATITATTGSASSTLTLPVEGTKLYVSGATTVAFGSSSTLSVKATDSSGAVISGARLSIVSSMGNALSKSTVDTDAQGQATVTYAASKAGTDTVTFSGLGASSAATVVVSGEDFSFTSPAAQTAIPVNTSQAVSVLYRQSGVGVSGKVVNFTTTGGTLSSAQATTNGSGVATVNVTSTSAAPATILATLASGTAQASLPVSFVATTPSKLVLQITPTAIGPNSGGSTTNQAQVVAKVTDANANPVPGITVNFSRDVDPSGGNFLQPSGTTDVNGLATVQYASGSTSTASSGVVLRGTVAGGSSVSGTATLTVSRSALFIALGTGNTILNADLQTYKKLWTVYVTDANGVAVSGASISVRILPNAYRKGRMVWSEDDSSWIVSPWNGVTLTTDSNGVKWLPAGAFISCQNEDARHGDNDARSFNGVLDSATEDVNGNGRLEPGNVISLDTSSGVVTTGSDGRATLTLLFAESYVPWVEVRLQVQAVVSGTASMTEAMFVVPGLAEDFTNQSIPPAGVISPFGYRPSCTDPN